MDTEDDTEEHVINNRRRSESLVDWTKANIFQFIRLFQSFPCLWNPIDPDYSNRRQRMQAWLTIKKEMGDQFTVNELRRRKDILLLTYKRCKKTAEELEAKNCVYKPTWFAYTIMDSFLDSTDKCPVTFMKTDKNENRECTSDQSSEEDDGKNSKMAAEDDTEDLDRVITNRCRSESLVDWKTENIFQFIRLFQSFPCLWNPIDPDYSNRRQRMQAWLTIKKEMGDRFTVNELRRRKDILLVTYKRCKKTAEELEAKNCVYKPTWFAYTIMDSFLDSIDKCTVAFVKTKKNEIKQRDATESSLYLEDSNSIAYSEPDEIKKEENYVLIVSAPEQGKNPLELPVKLEDRVNSTCEEQNDSEDDRVAAATPTPICWSTNDVLKFIELYKGQTVLWNADNPYRKSKHSLIDAWNAIRKDLDNRWTVDELKKKKESLLATYRSIKMKVIKSEFSKYVFQPSWFAFSAIDDFLGSIYKCSATSRSKLFKDQHQDDWNDSDDSEPEIKRENFVSIVSTTALKRKNPLELPIEVGDSKKSKEQTEEEDECSLFGKLVTSKLRKVSQDRRDCLMLKIIELFYKASQGPGEQ